MQPALPVPMPSGAAKPAEMTPIPPAIPPTLLPQQPPAAQKPAAPQMDTKMAALARAEVLSIFYKHGLTLGKSAAKPTFDQDSVAGAGIGTGIGAAGGAALGLHTASNIHVPPPQPNLAGIGAKAVGRPRTTAEALAELGKAEQVIQKTVQSVPKNLGMAGRIQQVIKAHGMKPVLAAIAAGGAELGVAGGMFGGLAGAAYHGYRHRKARKAK